MKDFSNDTGYMLCRVKINGVAQDVSVDVYDAADTLNELIKSGGIGDGQNIPNTMLKEAAAKFFDGSVDDWSSFSASNFWNAIQNAVKDLGNGELAESTPN